jgi:thioredoxin:protein disulfide reductase
MTSQKLASSIYRLAIGLGLSSTLLLTLGPSSRAYADTPQDLSKLDPVSISAIELKPLAPHAGDSVEVRVKLKIEPGFHAYVEQYRLVLKSPANFKLSGFDIQPTVTFNDPISHKDKIGTENYAEMVSLLDVPRDAMSGTRKLDLELTYQACSKDFCLFPKHIPASVDLQIAGASDDLFLSALSKGWLYALVMIFFAGVLTSLTPCIFPMIPITLAILGTKDYSDSRRKAFLISLCYVLGIATMYSILGVIAAKTGALFGAYLGSPIVVAIIAILFVIMGLSMYGLFELQMPQFITNKLMRGQSQKGFLGAFVSGLVAGIVASPCVGPVLISVLAYVAQTQNVWAGFIYLFVFALGMGQLFLVIGTFHNLWHKLPRSGPWLDQVKFIFGTIMIAMAFYYIHPVARGPIFDGLLAAALIAIAIAYGAFRPKNTSHTKFQHAHQSSMKVVFVIGILFVAKAVIPVRVQEQFFLDSETREHAVKTESPEWFHFSDEILQKAVAQKKAVVLDFKADWCLACKELDLKTFSDSRILAAGKNFIWLEYDATTSTPELEALRKRFQFAGLPFVVIFDSKGEWRKDLTLTGFEVPELFLKRMNSAL